MSVRSFRIVSSTLTAIALCGATLGLGADADAASRPAPLCGNADLHASYRADDAGMGHRWGAIVLRNVSTHTCWVDGFSGVSYVGHGNGTQIGAAAGRVGPEYRTLVGPGERVVGSLQQTVAQMYPAGRCRPTHVDGFRVYVPGSTLAQYVPHPTTGCADRAIHLLQIKSNRRP